MATYALTVSTSDLGLGVISGARVVVDRKRTQVADAFSFQYLGRNSVPTNSLGVATILLEPDDGSVYHEMKIFDLGGILVYSRIFTMPPQAVSSLSDLPVQDIVSASAAAVLEGVATATAQAVISTAQAAIATTQAGLATTNGAEQVALATAQAVIATTQAGLATTNGKAQVDLAEAQVALATAQAVLTAADRVQTGLDVIATVANRVQTGLYLADVQAAVSVGVGSLAVQTLAALNAITTAPTSSLGYVTNDGTSENNGMYQWNGTVWTKSIYDPLTKAKVYADERAEGVKNFVAQKLYVSLNNDLHQFADVEGNIVARIDQDGMFHVIGLENSIQLQFAEQKNELLGVVDSTVTLVQKSLNILTDQPDLYLFTDAEGNIVARISHDGQLHVVGLNQPIQIEFITLNEKVDAVSDTVNRLNYGTDDLYLVTDIDGSIVARIKEDGRYYIVGLSNDIATEFASVRDEIDKKAESIKDTSVAEIRSYKDTVTPQVQSVLNTLMYAQTGAKAPPPLHYFKQNYTIDSAWINNINKFGHSNSTRLSIATPYRTDDGVVHPHILEFYNGFRGYRYIVAITPYYLTNEAYENPCIYGSNDLINLTLLDGFTQPLDVRPQPAYSDGHNSDNVLAYDPKTGELICIWRQTLRNPNNDGVRVDALWMRKTKDGYNWTSRERIFKATDHPLAGGAGSPAIVYDVASGYWYMYLTTLSTTTDAMRLFKAKNLDENAWEYVATLTLPFKPWHQDIKIVGNKVCMLVYCYPPDNTIYFGIADDFTNFTWTQNLLLENNGYKASFVPEFNTNNEISLKILYSTDSSPSSNAEKWRMYMHQTNFMNVNLELR